MAATYSNRVCGPIPLYTPIIPLAGFLLGNRRTNSIESCAEAGPGCRCAMGFLWGPAGPGVDAHGLDVSEYAISQVRA